MSGKWYKKEEDAFICSSSLPINEIAKHLGRPYMSIACRITVLKSRGRTVEPKAYSSWGSVGLNKMFNHKN